MRPEYDLAFLLNHATLAELLELIVARDDVRAMVAADEPVSGVAPTLPAAGHWAA